MAVKLQEKELSMTLDTTPLVETLERDIQQVTEMILTVQEDLRICMVERRTCPKKRRNEILSEDIGYYKKKEEGLMEERREIRRQVGMLISQDGELEKEFLRGFKQALDWKRPPTTSYKFI